MSNLHDTVHRVTERIVANSATTRRRYLDLMDREREVFTVVSSGTWTIVMTNRGDLPLSQSRQAMRSPAAGSLAQKDRRRCPSTGPQ